MAQLRLTVDHSFSVVTESGTRYTVAPAVDQAGNPAIFVTRCGESNDSLDWPYGRAKVYDFVELVSRPGYCAALRFRNTVDPRQDILTTGLATLV